MRTFSAFVENRFNPEMKRQQDELIQRQQAELEKVQNSGDVNAMIQVLSRHAAELQALQNQIAQMRSNLPPRNPPQLPDELNIDNILGKQRR